MAAALFWTLYLFAPKHRRSSVAVAALVVIGLWGGLMIFGAVMPWPRVHSWLFGIGLALWLRPGIRVLLALASVRQDGAASFLTLSASRSPR